MLTFEYISPEHQQVIQEFNCADEIRIELFLKEQAIKLQQLRSAVTRLYFDENHNLVGYFTLYNDLIHVWAGQAQRHNWVLPDTHDYFPAVKLHYLAVDQKFRKQKYGEFLLAEAVNAVEEIASSSGCTFITIEALTNAIEFYESFVVRQRNPGSGEYMNMVLKLDELW